MIEKFFIIRTILNQPALHYLKFAVRNILTKFICLFLTAVNKCSPLFPIILPPMTQSFGILFIYLNPTLRINHIFISFADISSNQFLNKIMLMSRQTIITHFFNHVFLYLIKILTDRFLKTSIDITRNYLIILSALIVNLHTIAFLMMSFTHRLLNRHLIHIIYFMFHISTPP